MTNVDIYLRFASEALARSILPQGEAVMPLVNIDYVGAWDGGYHVNLRLPEDDSLIGVTQDYAISEPVTPRRVWA